MHITTVLKILCEDFPKCFKRSQQKVPLAKGIHRILFEHYKDDGRFSRRILRGAVAAYCLNPFYLKCLLKNLYRVDVHGKLGEKVSFKEAEYALKLLREREKTLKKPPVKAPEKAPVTLETPVKKLIKGTLKRKVSIKLSVKESEKT